MSEPVYDVGAADELHDGQMKEAEAGPQKILLARVKGRYYATSLECPHYGVSLAEGLLCGDRVVCPWHKSVFSVRTGELLEPPSLDGLKHYEVTVEGGRVFVHLPERAAAEPVRKQAEKSCFAIAGAGAAGVAAAEHLRELGFAGRLVLLSGEAEAPYDRTKLSKEFLSGNAPREELALRRPEFWEQHAIERVTARVDELHDAEHRLSLSDGTTLGYQKLLLALGSMPKTLDVPGAELGNIFTLRSQADAEAIWGQAQPGARTVIIGGSLIGLEVASCFASRQLPVTVIVREKTPFAKQFGPEVGCIFREWHERHGVEFRFEAAVERFEGRGVVRSVVLRSGEQLPADVVVLGMGVQPNTGLASGLPKREDGGIVTDDRLQVAEDVYAAGDIAAFPERYSGAAARIEHWRVAEQQGRTAARNMLGAGEAFGGVPYFWTNHFGTRFDYVGHAGEWDEVLLQMGKEPPAFIVFYIADSVVKAAAACRRDNEIAALHELMRLQRVPSAEAIRAGVDLIALARAT